MTVEEALEFVEGLLQAQGKRPLSDMQRALFRGSWRGQTYETTYTQENLAHRCSLEHLMRNVGPELWQLLSEVLGEQVNKKGLQGSVERARSRHLQGLSPPPEGPSPPPAPLPSSAARPPESWSNAPDTVSFHGREQSLETLRHWITLDGCRLVLVSGLVGIGKTLFATKLAREVQPQFDFVVWRSLANWNATRRSPTTRQLLADLLELPPQRATLSELLRHLQQNRYLIVLDALEALLGTAAFREILETLGQIPHQSCLLLTSREEPPVITRMKGGQKPVRALRLQGLGELAAREMLLAQGTLVGSEGDWRRLIRACEGHPQLLNAIASKMLFLCNGQIAQFLEQFQSIQGLEVRTLLAPAIQGLTPLERSICQYLHQRQAPPTAGEMLVGLAAPPHRLTLTVQELTHALERLNSKSLAYIEEGCYVLHPLLSCYFAHHPPASR